MFGRRKIAMLVAEFIGTALLASIVLAVSRSAVGVPYFVAIAVGLANAAMILTVGASSGAHVNPIVTLGLWTLKKISTIDALMYMAVQFAGGLAAWRLYTYLINDSLTNIAGTKFDWRVLVAEAIGSMIFTFGVASTVYQGFTKGVAAATVGLSLMAGVLLASVGGNGVINPAIALSIQSWSLAYVVGPVIGAIVGMNLYSLLFADRAVLLETKTTSAQVVSKPKARTAAKRSTTKRTATRKK